MASLAAWAVVVVRQGAVSGNRQNITRFVGDHRTYRDFAPLGRLFGLGEGPQQGLWQFVRHRATSALK
jgi:hypothetical protein